MRPGDVTPGAGAETRQTTNSQHSANVSTLHHPAELAHHASLPDLATAIAREHEQAEAHAATAVEHACKAGELLLEAKGQLEHGAWLPWLEANFPGSVRHAQRYMRVARSEDATRVSHLPLRQAVACLSTPRPDPVDRREEVGDDGHQSPDPVFLTGLPGKRRRRLNVRRIISETVNTLEGCTFSIDLLDGREDHLLRELDLGDVRSYRESLDASLKRLRRLSATLKKIEAPAP